MPRFQEVESGQAPPPGVGDLVAKRYSILQSLGRGSFGSVYLVQDSKASDGEQLKVLKQIPLGDLRPDETVRAAQEAQLLSQLQHPAILAFHHSFLHRDAFCIVTEFCQDRDLDCRLEEVRRAGRSLPEAQVVDWLIQLLLGLHYMHERRIIHRDLKAKNVFLKRNLLKIGDFGVSCLLMGSCDLASTFTGTPYYMSPELLTQQGYDSKSDVWALGCLLHEMCALTHAFQAPSFLRVVMKIVEGAAPALPCRYSAGLNSVMQSMLQKQPALRPSAAELLKTPFMEQNMKEMKERFEVASSGGEKEAQLLAKNMQTKVHLQTLMERSEVDKMTPRQRMRLRKQEAADEKEQRLRRLAEERYEQIHRELRRRREDSRGGGVCPPQPISSQDGCSPGRLQPIQTQEGETPELHDIPEDPQAAELYYDQDGFDSCSEDEETLHLSDPQISDLEAMMKHMQKVLDEELSAGGAVQPEAPPGPQGPPMINGSLLQTRIQILRESLCSRLGPDVFQQLYEELKEARRHDGGGVEAQRQLEDQPAGFQVERPDGPAGFQVERPDGPAGFQVERPDGPAGFQVERPDGPAGFQVERPDGPAGFQVERPDGPAGFQVERSDGPAGFQVERPDGPAGFQVERPDGPAGFQVERSDGPAGFQVERPDGPAGFQVERPDGPAGFQVERPDGPAGFQVEQLLFYEEELQRLRRAPPAGTRCYQHVN